MLQCHYVLAYPCVTHLQFGELARVLLQVLVKDASWHLTLAILDVDNGDESPLMQNRKPDVDMDDGKYNMKIRNV